MPVHPFFITSAFFPVTKHRIHLPILVRSTRPLRVSARLPKPPSDILAPLNLAQIARIVMSATQLSTFLTQSLINPLYTPQILAILPGNIPVIQALGLANLSTAITFHTHRSVTLPCRVANFVSFAITAALYLTSPLKPAYINLPFTSTLILIAISNVMSLSYLSKSPRNTMWSAAEITKLAAAGATLVAALSTAELLSRIYLLQIALNLVIAAVVAFYGPSRSRLFGAAEAFVLACLARCLVKCGASIGAVMVFAAALFTAWDALLGAAT